MTPQMGSFATLRLNRTLVMADVGAVDRFRDAFPHLYLTRGAYFLDGHHTIFKEISINLIVQHWLEAKTFVYADILINELRGKGDDLLEAIRQGHGSSDSWEFEAARVDLEFA